MTKRDVAHVIFKIGDTSFLISKSGAQFDGMKTAFYLYVNEVKTTLKRVIANGSNAALITGAMPYNDKQWGIIDQCGNC